MNASKTQSDELRDEVAEELKSRPYLVAEAADAEETSRTAAAGR
jgi:hypothetical protein